MTPRRVLLIDPPLVKHPLWDPIRTSQPLGIWSIGSFLQARGHTVRLLCTPLMDLGNVDLVSADRTEPCPDFIAGRRGRLESTNSDSLIDRWGDDRSHLRVGLSEKRILAEVSNYQPDLIGIATLATCMHESFVRLAKAIRERFPGVPIIAGGQHATAMPEELLRGSEGGIDLVVVGEGEHVTLQILDLLPNLKKARSIAGVAYLDEDGVFFQNPRPPFTDLATLPPLDPYLLEDLELPPVPTHTFGRQPVKFTDMMFSVGCHRGCPYCFSPVMRGKLRQSSPSQILEQLHLLKEHGYEELVLQDDDLLNNKDFFLALLRTFREVGLRWQDNGGMELELFDDELVEAIIESGCTSIYVPVNPRQLADRLPTEKAIANIRFLRRLKDSGMYTFTSGIYGVPNLVYPEQTYDDLLRLRDFHVGLVEDGYVDASLVFPLSTLPGTVWFRQAQKSEHFFFDREDWIGYSIFVPQVYARQLGRRRLWYEILETHRALNEIQHSYPWFSPFPNCLNFGEPSVTGVLAQEVMV